MAAFDDIMNGRRQPRGARMMFQQQDDNNANNAGTPSLNEKELKTEEEKKQAPGSPLGVRANKAREQLTGPTGNAGVSAASSRSSLRVSTPMPTVPSGVKAAGISSQPSLSVNMSGDADAASRRLKETIQHIETPVKIADYGDILRYYKQPKTNDELADEEKRQKRNETLARVGDAIGAFHDAYSYARGVKPLERGNLSEKSRQRYEKLRAEWNQDRDSYVKAVLRQRAEQRNDENAASIREYRESMQRAKEREIKAREDNYAALRALKEEQQRNAEKHKQEEAQRKKEELEQKKKESESRIAKNNRTGTGKSGGSKSGGNTTKTTYKEDVYDKSGHKVGTRTTTTTTRGGSGGAKTSDGAKADGDKKQAKGTGKKLQKNKLGL